MSWDMFPFVRGLDSSFLDEGEAEDLQAYNRMSHLILKRCRMVVVCGKEVTGTMNTDISTADRLHIICTTLDGLIKIKEKGSIIDSAWGSRWKSVELVLQA